MESSNEEDWMEAVSIDKAQSPSWKSPLNNKLLKRSVATPRPDSPGVSNLWQAQASAGIPTPRRVFEGTNSNGTSPTDSSSDTSSPPRKTWRRSKTTTMASVVMVTCIAYVLLATTLLGVVPPLIQDEDVAILPQPSIRGVAQPKDPALQDMPSTQKPSIPQLQVEPKKSKKEPKRQPKKESKKETKKEPKEESKKKGIEESKKEPKKDPKPDPKREKPKEVRKEHVEKKPKTTSIPPRIVTLSTNHDTPRFHRRQPMLLALPLDPIGPDEEEHAPTIRLQPTNVEILVNKTVHTNQTITLPNGANQTVTNQTASSEDADAVSEDKAEFHIDDETNPTEGNPDDTQATCEAVDDWQSESYPNCNTVHEIDMIPTAPSPRYLGQGWFRGTWRLDRQHASRFGDDQDDSIVQEESVVLKTLRLEREFLAEYYELHRRDALAMEHLTFSPFVMNIYGYCGQSAINELAEFREGVDSLEQLDRRMRGRQGKELMLLKVRLALSVSLGLYHVHYGRPGLPWNEPESDDEEGSPLPTMAHYDINPRNIAVVAGGKPKLNDFNTAEFLRYPTDNEGTVVGNETCGFPSRLHEPWWRAPEEVDVPEHGTPAKDLRHVTEKVDVYALGNVLFHILTTHSPRGKMKRNRMEGIRELVRRGVAPEIPEPFKSSKDRSVKAFRKAMERCFEPDPKLRATSREVATILFQVIEQQAGSSKRRK